LNLHTPQGPDIAQAVRVLDASPRVQPVKAAVVEKSSAPRLRDFPNTSHREATRDLSRSVAPPQQHPALRSAPIPQEHKAAAPAQIASSAPARSTPPVAQFTSAIRDAKTGSAKLAEPPVRQSSAPTQIVQPPPTTKPQANPAAVPNPVVTKPAPNPASTQPVPNPVAQKPTPVAAPAPAYVPPRPLKWVQPDQHLLGGSNPSAPVDITVKVKIDETGHVTAAHALIVGAKHDKKLMAAAAAAVRQWVFEPAKSHGTNVASEETIVVHLGPAAQ
jgi:hypothetical protein